MGLYIGVTTASSNLGESPINQAILRLAARVAEYSRDGSLPPAPSLDVTFMLPGAQDRPSFSGMRMGAYDKVADTLYFEKAVPEHILHSEEAGRFVSVVMEEVVENAGNFFAEHGMPFDRHRWLAVVDRLTVAEGAMPLSFGTATTH